MSSPTSPRGGGRIGWALGSQTYILWRFGYLRRYDRIEYIQQSTESYVASLRYNSIPLSNTLASNSFPRTILIPLILIPNYSSINFLAGNPLNRASWVRSSPIILNNTAHSPHTRWLLLNAGDPLVQPSTGHLFLLSSSHLRPIFEWRAPFDEGDESGDFKREGALDQSKVFGQVYVPPDQREGRHGGEFADMMTARVTPAPVVVFLGVLESSSDSVNQPEVQVGDGIKGVPYFALDVAGTGKEQDVLDLKLDGHDGGLMWGSARLASASFTNEEAAIFGEARSMLDWNARNKVCVLSLSYSPLSPNDTDGDGNGSFALAVGHAHFPSGEGGSWVADHSYLVHNPSLSLVLPGESLWPPKWQSINLGEVAGRDYITSCTPGRTLSSSRPSLTKLGIGYYWGAMCVILLLRVYFLIPVPNLQKKFPGSTLRYQKI